MAGKGAWFAIGTARGNQSTFWFPEFGTQQRLQAKYPHGIVNPYAFKSRSDAQAYCDQNNGTPPGGGGPGKPGKPPKKPENVNGNLILSLARGWLGVPYLYGGTTRQGVDCSGLVLNVCSEAGIKGCPRTSEEQWAWCQHIQASDAGAGDLVFFVGAEIDPPPGHVGILVNRNTMIDAPFTGTTVRYDTFTDGPGVNRIIGYGRIPGSGKALPAPAVTARQGGTVIAGSIGSIIAQLAVILILLAVLFLFIGALLWWKVK